MMNEDAKARVTLGQFTEAKLLVPRLLSERYEGAIHELTQRLAATGRIENASAFLEAALKREAEMPTFSEGVAVPHVRGGTVRKLSVAAGLSATGIAWGLERHRAAHVVFLVAVPLTEAQTYLFLLSGLSNLIHDEVGFTALKRATQPEEMHSVLNAIGLVRTSAQPGGPGRR